MLSPKTVVTERLALRISVVRRTAMDTKSPSHRGDEAEAMRFYSQLVDVGGARGQGRLGRTMPMNVPRHRPNGRARIPVCLSILGV
jgi:hypothetical protein